MTKLRKTAAEFLKKFNTLIDAGDLDNAASLLEGFEAHAETQKKTA